MKPQRLKEEIKTTLPYAEPEAEPETWAIDLCLEAGLPSDILDCLATSGFKEEAIVEAIEEYKEFESKLPEVIYDRQYAITEDFTVKFPAKIRPDSAKGKLLLAKANRIWQLKKRPGICRNIIIKYCRVCGRADCDYMPVTIILTIKG